ncbi:MAG: carboxylating nicotinate-nucleotide diphosphorylase [Ignavibacteria bacterium]
MNISDFYRKFNKEINEKISDALNEDRVKNDVTSLRLFSSPDLNRDKRITAKLVCKENCVLAGFEIFKKVFRNVDKKLIVKEYFKDGDRLKKNTIVSEISGRVIKILQSERVALNFIQRMSAVATITSRFVSRLKYKNSKILHTRKTTPNFRLFEIAAVKIGGGDFHRFGLNSSVLIKDNHIKSAGSLTKVLDLFKKSNTKKKSEKLEIEVKSLNELNEVVKKGNGLVKVVMLDNFNPELVSTAVEILKKNNIKIELSGGINEENFGEFQFKGIDYYSIGLLTHSYKSVDFSLEF